MELGRENQCHTLIICFKFRFNGHLLGNLTVWIILAQLSVVAQITITSVTALFEVKYGVKDVFL